MQAEQKDCKKNCRLEAVTIRVEAIAIKVEAIAIEVEAIASRFTCRRTRGPSAKNLDKPFAFQTLHV